MRSINWATTLLVFLGVLGLMTACAGLDSGDFIRVQMPKEVQKGLGVPPSVTLNESYRVAEDWETGGRRLAEEMAEGEESRQLFNSILEFGGSIAIPYIEANVPFGAGGAALATLILGQWFGNRSGYKRGQSDAEKKTGQEKIDSFNKGMKVAGQIADKAAAGEGA